MTSKAKFVAIAVLIAAGLGLAACDEHEQGRVLRYEKGKYLGKADTSLTEEQIDELRQRARLQQGG